MTDQYIAGRVAVELCAKVIVVDISPYIVVHQRHGMKIARARIPGDCLQGRFGAENLWRPVHLWIDPPQQAEGGPPDCLRNGAAQDFFITVPAIPPITAKDLVAAIPGKPL